MIATVMPLMLSAGKKGAAKVGSKLTTTVAASVATKVTTDKLKKSETELSKLPEEEQAKESMVRTIRDASITAGFSIIGAVVYSVASNLIESSN